MFATIAVKRSLGWIAPRKAKKKAMKKAMKEAMKKTMKKAMKNRILKAPSDVESDDE